jgi:DNA repair exonuclease SbcCD nuclease subunit
MNIVGKHVDMPIAAFGDIHGVFDVIRSKAKIYFLENIVCFACGDFGVGFCYNNPIEPRKEKKRLSDLNLFLKKRNIFLYVVRGNHDNPTFFDGKHNLSNLIFMQDYDVVEVGEHNILGIGGATSVDRKENPNFGFKGRREGIDWWPDEKVVYDEEKLQSLGGIDMVVSHTCPDFIYPSVENKDVERWIEYDPELRQELENK